MKMYKLAITNIYRWVHASPAKVFLISLTSIVIGLSVHTYKNRILHKQVYQAIFEAEINDTETLVSANDYKNRIWYAYLENRDKLFLHEKNSKMLGYEAIRAEETTNGFKIAALTQVIPNEHELKILKDQINRHFTKHNKIVEARIAAKLDSIVAIATLEKELLSKVGDDWSKLASVRVKNDLYNVKYEDYLMEILSKAFILGNVSKSEMSDYTKYISTITERYAYAAKNAKTLNHTYLLKPINKIELKNYRELSSSTAILKSIVLYSTVTSIILFSIWFTLYVLILDINKRQSNNRPLENTSPDMP